MPAKEEHGRMWFWLIRSWQTWATWHFALWCWKTWSKFRCCRKRRTIGSRISSLYFTAFSIPWKIWSWVRPSWQFPAQAITFPPLKRPDTYTLIRKTFPMHAVHTKTSIAKKKWNRDSSLKRRCCQVWSLQQPCARAQASLAILWRCLGIGPTTGRLARSPDSRSLLRTVWLEIRTFARKNRCSTGSVLGHYMIPGVTKA
jgi:hypothetical protein